MALKLLNNDVLDFDASALIITVDGQSRRLRGNIAHAFIRRWPEDYEDFESQLTFPMSLGSARLVKEDTDCPWNTLIFISTLHHMETLTTDEKLNVTRLALGNALSAALARGLTSVSTAVLKGGWRLPLDLAFKAMVDTYESSEFGRQGRTLNICSIHTEEFEKLREVADVVRPMR